MAGRRPANESGYRRASLPDAGRRERRERRASAVCSVVGATAVAGAGASWLERHPGPLSRRLQHWHGFAFALPRLDSLVTGLVVVQLVIGSIESSQWRGSGGGRAMATKIFSFPVRGCRWCFSAIVPDVPARKYSSVVTLSQLWERLRALPQFTDRAELMESFASTKVSPPATSPVLFAPEILAERDGPLRSCLLTTNIVFVGHEGR